MQELRCEVLTPLRNLPHRADSLRCALCLRPRPGRHECCTTGTVQTPAALVAIPLLAGAAAGLLLPIPAGDSLPLRAAGGAVVALVSACGLRGFADEGVLVSALLIGCSLAGLSLGITSARRAYSPPLVAWFAGRDAGERFEPALIEGCSARMPRLIDSGSRSLSI